MSRKLVLFIIVLILIVAASSFYFATQNEDKQISDKVFNLEKNLVLAQLRRITFEDFKNNTSSFFHPYFHSSFFDVIEQQYNEIGHGDIATVTGLPLYEEISKVYTSEDKKSKYVFVIISDEHIANLAAYQYQFIQHEGQWKIRNKKYYTLSKDMTRPGKDAARFTIFGDKTIEYMHTRILDK